MASLIPDFSGVPINTAGAMKNYLDASNAVATSINKPLDRITALVESNELARKNKLAEDSQAAQDARQVIADKQNKQLFDLKMEDANRAKQDLVDRDAYLKGIVNPSAYGLKAGTEDVVNWLGSYTGNDAIAQAGIAAGPGTPEYEALFKRNEDIGNYITGKSLDDRTIGFSTANPNNRYAAEEMMKATISRQNALDKEAKDVADNQLKYQLESLKQSGKGSTGVSEDGTSTSKVGMTAGGYKVSSPDEVAETATKLLKSTYGLKPEDPLHQKVAGLVAGMANMNYSASQITEAANKVFTPGKSIDYWPDKAPEFKDIAVNVGTPKNVAVPTATNKEYTDTLSGLSQSYADRLAKIQEQRDGTYGMDKIRELISGPAQGSASVSKSNDGKTLTERINNPGAVKQADKGDKSVMWKGQTGYDDQGHAVFDTVENGFRAQAINLNTQISRQPTVEELIKGSPEKGIEAYATGNQNEYVKFISDKLGVDKNYALKPDDIPRLLKAQSQFEGSAFNETAANIGYQMAVEEGKIKVTPKTTVKDLFAKVEEKKVEDKITTDFSKLNDEDIQTGIEVYTGAEKEAYQKEAVRRRVEKLDYNNTVHPAPVITTEPKVEKDARNGLQIIRDIMSQGVQDTYEQGKKGVKEFVVPLVKPAYDAFAGDKPSQELRTAVALVNNSAGALTEIAMSPYTVAKKATDFFPYGMQSQGDSIFQKQAKDARATAIREMNKLGVTNPTQQEIALFVSEAIMPVGPLSKTGSMIRNSLKNPSANIDNIMARIDDFNKITPKGSASEKLAGVKRSAEYAKDAAEFEARALQKERQAATNTPKEVRDAVEATIKAHADESSIIQSVSETLQGIGGRGVLSQADEVVILNSLEKLQGLSSKSTIEVLRELKLSPKVERYIMDTFNQKR